MKDPLLQRRPEERKRIAEVILVVITSCLLLGLSRLETRLFSLSETLAGNREFFTTLAYFALINLNVILILFLSFLIFRNVTKLVVERRRGVLGSRLRTKLVFALVFFALAPTLLLFYVSMQFVTSSFETWFSEKVRVTMQQTREAGSLVYKQDQKRLQSLARIALQRVRFQGPADIFSQESSGFVAHGLEGFASEYGINTVKVYDVTGGQVWSSARGYGSQIPQRIDPYVETSLSKFFEQPQLGDLSTVVGEEQQDVVKGVAPIRDPLSGRLMGLVITEVRFETQILESVEKIIADFANLKPGAQLIRLSYMILMVVMTLLIVFSATWMGFYVARGITGPLQSLAEATREIALGNYNVSLSARNDDETGQLVHAFNLMTDDLREHQRNTEQAQARLQHSNEELDQRRQYMEIVLKHITAGVISLDSRNQVTSVNSAAERLLGIHAQQLTGRTIRQGLRPELYEALWQPVDEALQKRGHFHGQLELNNGGLDVTLLTTATRIYDEHEVEVGSVVVFDDAREQARAQRVAAWREVARRIAHEIKNPITPIKLNAQRLLRRFHNKFTGEEHEVFKSCIETIINQVDSLRDLVNEFSKFSRLPTIQPKRANLNEVIEEVAKLFRMSYPEVTIDSSGLAEIPAFPLDKEQLNRAFVNLFTNAIAAFVGGRPGKVRVACSYLWDLNTVRVELSDNGCGIPKELRDRVLEPYFSTKDEGTGLGLAIVNQIITDHGGYLRLTANYPHGTTVVIELPLGVDAERGSGASV